MFKKLLNRLSLPSGSGPPRGGEALSAVNHVDDTGRVQSVRRDVNPRYYGVIEEFAKLRPDIKVTLRAPYDSYEEGTQKVLREAVTNQMPDVTFQGLNRIRVLVDKNIPAELDGYIAAEKDFENLGVNSAGEKDCGGEGHGDEQFYLMVQPAFVVEEADGGDECCAGDDADTLGAGGAVEGEEDGEHDGAPHGEAAEKRDRLEVDFARTG